MFGGSAHDTDRGWKRHSPPVQFPLQAINEGYEGTRVSYSPPKNGQSVRSMFSTTRSGLAVITLHRLRSRSFLLASYVIFSQIMGELGYQAVESTYSWEK
jgi:hypothetical protein